MIGLFQGLAGSRSWRGHLSENAHKPNAGIQVVLDAHISMQAAAMESIDA
jgi:tRNA-dihydrouridine synthase A